MKSFIDPSVGFRQENVHRASVFMSRGLSRLLLDTI